MENDQIITGVIEGDDVDETELDPEMVDELSNGRGEE